MRQLLSPGRVAVVAIVAVMAIGLSPPASARDFFSSFFGGLVGASPPPAPSIPLPYAAEFGDATAQPAPTRPARSTSASAYCVRTCDGRYFPVPVGGQSRAETCKSFCPASETKVVYGSAIDSAATETGKPYSELPNAFRYRNELVAGCTCNGKDPGGLAKIDIQNDPTVRKGDLVAGANGLIVAERNSNRRSTTASSSSVPKRVVRARLESMPVVAAQ